MNEILIYLQSIYEGNGIAIYDSLVNREKMDSKTIGNEALKYKDRHIVNLMSPDYPNFLKNGYKPPFIVELEGEKVYYIYGKDLSKKGEIKNDTKPATIKDFTCMGEQKYNKFINKVGA